MFQKAARAREVRRHRETQHGGRVARSQHRRRRMAVLDSAGRLASKTSIGIAFSATLPSAPSSRSACSAGAITATTAPALRAICSYTCLPDFMSSPDRSARPASTACGGTRFWKDGRDAPDVMLGVLDYPETETHPEFTLSLRVNLACGNVTESFGFRFVGSEGQMTVGFNGLTLAKVPRETQPGYTIDTFPKNVREDFLRTYRQQYPPTRPQCRLNQAAGRNDSSTLPEITARTRSTTATSTTRSALANPSSKTRSSD